MKKNTKKIASTVLTTVLAVGVAAASTQAVAKSANCPVEKCYGIAKKAKNDCGTPKHACAAQSTRDGAKSEWIYVMKGSCNSIVGGSLTPPGGASAKK